MTVALTGLLFAALLALSLIDLKEQRLPDKITLPLIALGLILSWTVLDQGLASTIGAAAGYLTFFAVETLYRKARGVDGLGRGDAKLLSAGGAWCAWWSLPYIILVASLLALFYVLTRSLLRMEQADAKTRIPFGPFLSLGIALLWLVNAYWPNLITIV